MVRGTTPIHVFAFPFDLSGITDLFITYTQGGDAVLEKTLEDVQIDGSTVTVRLSQADTLAFTAGRPVYIQVRTKDADGNAQASEIITTTAGRILRDGEI